MQPVFQRSSRPAKALRLPGAASGGGARVDADAHKVRQQPGGRHTGSARPSIGSLPARPASVRKWRCAWGSSAATVRVSGCECSRATTFGMVRSGAVA